MIKLNEKAFTLIELISIITILTMIILITVPIVNNVIMKNKEKTYQAQIHEIERATEGYVAENIREVLPGDTVSKEFTISELKDKEVIAPNRVINPKTGKEMTGCVKVTLDDNNQFHAKYTDTPCK